MEVGLTIIGDVVILPGIPALVEAHMPALAALLPEERFFVRTVRCWGREVDLAAAAEKSAAEHREVEVGSYPILASGESPGHVLVKFTGRNEACVIEATERFLAALPTNMPRDLVP